MMKIFFAFLNFGFPTEINIASVSSDFRSVLDFTVKIG